MSRFWLGIICGVGFGVIDVLMMIPLKYENNRKMVEAMTAAFIERFMIGFLIPNISLAMNPAIKGLVMGVLLSLPSAIISRVYGPIVGIGAVGGLIIGIITK